MARFVRFMHVLRKGSSRQRAQVWLGLLLVAATTIWVVFNLWQLLVVMVGFLVGLYLIGRSLRDTQSSSSSSSSSSS